VRSVIGGAKPSCCGPSAKRDAPLGFDIAPIARDLYAKNETEDLPAGALLASFGCERPTALAELRPGEVVLAADELAVRPADREPTHLTSRST
jgi:hypothetical protein